ncbi:hypothetical protein ACFFTU_29450 [Streptomyces cremeus]|uniref:Aspartate/ornithine carbamoyltransferase Asp/Orn-binding domain-containing protein n=1 Tax=Streptomyces cremeus TaxID=66881 RepID=A0ABV5PLH2_STRCM
MPKERSTSSSTATKYPQGAPAPLDYWHVRANGHRISRFPTESLNTRTIPSENSLEPRYPHAAFMHDLPDRHGIEITAKTLNEDSSISFRKAENNMHSAPTVLA